MAHTGSVAVRAATMQDAPLITSFNERLCIESEGRALDHATIEAGVRAALSDATRCLYFVAEQGGQVVGQTMITSEWSDWRNGWFWWIQSVYVDPGARRRGVFRALHRHIETEARRRGDVCGLRLYVEEENHRARRTYEGLSMKKTGYLLYETDWSGAVRDGAGGH